MATHWDGTEIAHGVFGGRPTVEGFDVSGHLDDMTELHDMADGHVPWMGDSSSPRQPWPAGHTMWDGFGRSALPF